jgi:hypothetical protein
VTKPVEKKKTIESFLGLSGHDGEEKQLIVLLRLLSEWMEIFWERGALVNP